MVLCYKGSPYTYPNFCWECMLHREEENEEEYKERIESQLAAQEEDDVERIKEESRRRRQAILEKYKQQQQQKLNAEPLTDMFTGIDPCCCLLSRQGCSTHLS